jgi:hypothetical protein
VLLVLDSGLQCVRLLLYLYVPDCVGGGVITAIQDIRDTYYIPDILTVQWKIRRILLRIGRKGKYLNTLEKYYIYRISRGNLHMSDTNIDEHNQIFEELQKIYDISSSHTTQPCPTDTVGNV